MSLFKKLKSMIIFTNPRHSARTFSALYALTLMIISHIIDDPQSIYPLSVVYQDVFQKIASFTSVTDRSDKGLFKNFAANTFDIFLDSLIKMLPFRNLYNEYLGDVFKQKHLKRALLDLGSLITLKDLRGYEPKVIKLIGYDHAAFGLPLRGLFMRQIFKEPDIHLPMISGFIDLAVPIHTRI